MSKDSRQVIGPDAMSSAIQDPPLTSISIVSHGQGDLVTKALQCLANVPGPLNFEVLITLNIPEQDPQLPLGCPFPAILIRNARPKGFGANHNQAFQQASGDWFCVMNPDILVSANPFGALIAAAERHKASVVGPAVVAPDGALEDSVRKFPTPMALLRKAMFGNEGRYPYLPGSPPFAADWIGGMFMLFRADAFRDLNGFDEGFFLYYEDVDICVRVWRSGRRVFVCPQAQVIHDARRSSHRNFRYLRWHLSSLSRYLRKHWLRLPNTDQAT